MANNENHQGLVFKNFIVRYGNRFYRVTTTRFKLNLLRKYALDKGTPYMAYYSKREGMEFDELIKLLGLEYNSGVFRKFSEPQEYEDPDALNTRIKTNLILATLFLVLTSILISLIVAL